MKIQSIITVILLGGLIMFSSCGDEGIMPTTPVEEEMEEMEMENNENSDNLEAAPDFSIKTWDNADLKFEDFSDKVLVIWFFGSDCPPCKTIGPSVEERLNKDFREKEDYAIIGIDQWDRNNATIEGFKKTTGIEFPLGAMGSGVASDYDTTYDRLVVVNKDGKIAYKADSRATNNIDEVVDIAKGLTK